MPKSKATHSNVKVQQIFGKAFEVCRGSDDIQCLIKKYPGNKKIRLISGFVINHQQRTQNRVNRAQNPMPYRKALDFEPYSLSPMQVGTKKKAVYNVVLLMLTYYRRYLKNIVNLVADILISGNNL